MLADLLSRDIFLFHTCLNTGYIGLGDFFCRVIFCKMTARRVRIRTVHAEQIDLGKSHVEGKFCCQ